MEAQALQAKPVDYSYCDIRAKENYAQDKLT